MTATPPFSSRPRLTPGIPTGGVLAVLVTVGVMASGLSASREPADSRLPLRASIAFAPPAPPAPPPAPRVPRQENTGGVPDVDAKAIAREVRDLIAEAEERAVAASKRGRFAESDIRRTERYENADGLTRLTFEAVAPAGLRLADINGNIRIKVDPAGDRILADLRNSRRRFRLDVEDGILWITGGGGDSNPPVDLDLAVPQGTPLLVNGHVGEISVIGDLKAPVRIDLRQGRIDIPGRVASARVRVSGTGEVVLSEVDDLLAIQMSGAGAVRCAKADRVAAEVAGAGAVRVGRVEKLTSLNLPGRGAVDIASAEGAFRAALPGAAEVKVASGTAQRLQVASLGVGSFRFGGVAVDPQIRLAGPGRVELAKVDGTPVLARQGPGEIVLGR